MRSIEFLKVQGVQLIVAIIISTVVLLVVVAYTTSFFIWIRKTVFHGDITVSEDVEKK